MTYDAEDSNKNASAAVGSEGEQFSDGRSRETFQSRSTLIGQLQTLIVVQGPQQAAFVATKSRFCTDSSPCDASERVDSFTLFHTSLTASRTTKWRSFTRVTLLEWLHSTAGLMYRARRLIVTLSHTTMLP